MTFDFRVVGVDFPPAAGQVQTQTRTVGFGRHINRATTVINGFNVRYSDGDHPFFRQFVDTSSVTIDNNNNAVKFTVRLLISDKGDIDDRFQGTVDVVVVADVD